MRCRKARSDFNGYLNHSLDLATADRIRNHLAHCRDCADELRFLKAYREKVAAPPQEKAPADLVAKVRQRINQDEAKTMDSRAPFGRPVLLTPQITGMVAVLCVIFLALGIHQYSLKQFRGATSGQTAGPKTVADGETGSKNRSSLAAAPQNGLTPTRKESPTGKIAVRTVPAGSAPRTERIVSGDALRTRDSNIVAEQKAESQPDWNEPAAAPKAIAAEPRIVRLMIVSEDARRQSDSDVSMFPKILEGGRKSYGTVSVKKSESKEPSCVGNAGVFDLPALLEKYQGRIIASDDESQKNVQIRVLEIPGLKYHDFLIELGKMGRLREMLQATVAPEGISEELELHLQSGN